VVEGEECVVILVVVVIVGCCSCASAIKIIRGEAVWQWLEWRGKKDLKSSAIVDCGR